MPELVSNRLKFHLDPTPSQICTPPMKTVKDKKRKVFKAILDSPYAKPQWPVIDTQGERIMVESLEALLRDGVSAGRIVVGFNSVNEEAEACSATGHNDESVAMFVCRSDIDTPLVTSHFPLLSVMSRIKLIQLQKGSADRLAKALQASPRDCSVLLVKSNISGGSALYQQIDKVENVSIPWLERHVTKIQSLQTTAGVAKKVKKEQKKAEEKREEERKVEEIEGKKKEVKSKIEGEIKKQGRN